MKNKNFFSLPLFFTILITIAGLYFYSCSSDEDKSKDDDTKKGNGNGTETETELKSEGVAMPLTLKSTWKYNYDAGKIDKGIFTMTAVENQTVNETEVTKIDYTGEIYGDNYWILLKNTDEGIRFYGDEHTGKLKTPDLWLKYPCKEGDKWETSKQGKVVKWEVVSTSETIKVPAGEFTCIHVRGIPEGTSSPADHWWAINVGEVKFEIELGTTKLVGELESYKIQ